MCEQEGLHTREAEGRSSPPPTVGHWSLDSQRAERRETHSDPVESAYPCLLRALALKCLSVPISMSVVLGTQIVRKWKRQCDHFWREYREFPYLPARNPSKVAGQVPLPWRAHRSRQA